MAIPARGSLMGNRGILHKADQTLGPARWRHKAWITCVLSFKGRRRPLMAPGRYTELFFHDEAVACAAGHRPCAECRRADFTAFQAAWRQAIGGDASAPAIDRALHAARVVSRSRAQITHTAAIDTLPDGCFIRHDGVAARVAGNDLWPFQGNGYGAPIARPRGGTATVLTPAPLVAVMRAGWHPAV